MSCSHCAKDVAVKNGPIAGVPSDSFAVTAVSPSYTDTGSDEVDSYISQSDGRWQPALEAAMANADVEAAKLIQSKLVGDGVPHGDVLTARELAQQILEMPGPCLRDTPEAMEALNMERLAHSSLPEGRELYRLWQSRAWASPDSAGEFVDAVNALDDVADQICLKGEGILSADSQADSLVMAAGDDLVKAYETAVRMARTNSDMIPVRDTLADRLNMSQLPTSGLVAARLACTYMNWELHTSSADKGQYADEIRRLSDEVPEGAIPEFDEAVEFYFNQNTFEAGAAHERLLRATTKLLDGVKPPMPDTFENENAVADWLTRHADYHGSFQPMSEHQGDLTGITLVLADPQPFGEVRKLFYHAAVQANKAPYDELGRAKDPLRGELVQVVQLNLDPARSEPNAQKGDIDENLKDGLQLGQGRTFARLSCDFWVLADKQGD